VDDNEINVKASRALGITSIRFQSMALLREELAELPLPVLPVLSEQPHFNISPPR
jgi:hypothetical protein